MHDPQLAYEREQNKQYYQALDRRVSIKIKGVDQRRMARDWGPLTARVSLVPECSDDEDQFYIAGRQATLGDGTRVISWASPAAAAFFKRTPIWNGQQVRVVRRFQTRATEIHGFADDWLIPPQGPAFPAKRGKINRPPGSPAGEPSTPAKGLEPTPSRTTRPKSPHSLDTARSPQSPATTPEPPSRADLVLNAMCAPRRTDLPSVLATLSTEQYDLVTSDPRESIYVSGHPGTGKTIIATHRAAWLTHPERRHRLDNVLLVGPSDAWVASVTASVKELSDAGTVTVLSVPSLLSWLLGQPPGRTVRTSPRRHETVTDTSQGLVRVLYELPIAQLGSSVEESYDTVRRILSTSGSGSLRGWARTLPVEFSAALETPTLHPMLAYLAVTHFRRQGKLKPFRHVVVDEAQDLRPLEWAVLGEANNGNWTILGDRNQRRTLFSDISPQEYQELLGRDVQRRNLDKGYRSTQQIMDFASRLLERPGTGRSTSVLGAGAPPTLIDAGALGRTVESVALSQVPVLLEQLAIGATAAIISTNTRLMRLAAQHAGWNSGRARGGVTRYRKSIKGRTREVHVLTPENARGLEFDVVIVLEPADFVVNLTGNRRAEHLRMLYTSLTRANRLLCIVYDKPLPQALRAAIPD